MLNIDCPYCGPRAEIEFRCGGETHIQRPGPLNPELGEADDAAWGDYLYTRANPKGEHLERWVHSAGCQRWFNVARNTVTHRIRLAYAMTDQAPEPEA